MRPIRIALDCFALLWFALNYEPNLDRFGSW